MIWKGQKATERQGDEEKELSNGQTESDIYLRATNHKYTLTHTHAHTQVRTQTHTRAHTHVQTHTHTQ